jgi:hypothetical protein
MCSGSKMLARGEGTASSGGQLSNPGTDVGAAGCRISSISPSFDGTMSWQT